MRLFLLIFTCFLFGSTHAEVKQKAELTQFNHPFLLGDWYLFNPDPDSTSEDFLAIRLTLESDYVFTIEIQKKDHSVDYWQGNYEADETTLVLGMDTETPQVYYYNNNHNQLNLNGVIFQKALPTALVGSWTSESLAGDDILASDVSQMDLVLQADFVFSFRVVSGNGNEATHEGIYIIEGDHLVLMYSDGEQDSRYTLIDNQLTLDSQTSDMYAVLNRVE
ncbi:hypothetical protein [Vibrio penaeicida]|uniref:WD40 repeat protein n=1 Tax=Vibrio penaeicida TaxID=104609 RepID=A0AAV5NJF8_9VIBR|nr:hypothetical protein [Vibrio penaeicida]RTZ22733.1 hypothetical protein EKN09_12595 [Vibrio penaeicida]GLQ70749.1 hypothetical protein GCM10007932_01090 [Vibrio penaeicida]